MGLCTLLHNKAIHSVFEEELDNQKDEKNLAITGESPGPLSPNFVRALLRFYAGQSTDTEHIKVEHDTTYDVYINTERQQVKIFPWDPEDCFLPSNIKRWEATIIDPLTRQMRDGTEVPGTKSNRY